MNAVFRKLRWLIERSDKEAELREELKFQLRRKRRGVGRTASRRTRPAGRRAATWAHRGRR